MPRRSKGPRLYLDPAENVYVIRDGARKRRTGCGPAELSVAEERLRDYIAEKYQPVGDHRPDRVLVADTLTFYLREVAPAHKSPATTAASIDRLLDWWRDRTLAEVKKSTCREYVKHRTSQPRRQARKPDALKQLTSPSTARRELGVLQAAIAAYHAEYTLDAVPVVSLPEPAAPRERWLFRSEAARFLWSARHHPERPARKALIRFFLLSIYSGSRPGVSRAVAWIPTTTGAWADLNAGVLHRRGIGQGESKKRRPPARLPTRLLSHMKRWKRNDGAAAAYVVDQGFGPLKSQRRAWEWVRQHAGLGKDVTPHVLRHTAATWIMQQGPDLWEAAGFLGMSPETLWKVYGHHHPDWQRDLANKIGRRIED